MSPLPAPLSPSILKVIPFVIELVKSPHKLLLKYPVPVPNVTIQPVTSAHVDPPSVELCNLSSAEELVLAVKTLKWIIGVKFVSYLLKLSLKFVEPNNSVFAIGIFLQVDALVVKYIVLIGKLVVGCGTVLKRYSVPDTIVSNTAPVIDENVMSGVDVKAVGKVIVTLHLGAPTTGIVQEPLPCSTSGFPQASLVVPIAVTNCPDEQDMVATAVDVKIMNVIETEKNANSSA